MWCTFWFRFQETAGNMLPHWYFQIFGENRNLIMLLLQYQSHVWKQRSRLLSRRSPSPALPPFTSSWCSSPMFLKPLEAVKSPGDTVATLILIQQNWVALTLYKLPVRLVTQMVPLLPDRAPHSWVAEHCSHSVLKHAVVPRSLHASKALFPPATFLLTPQDTHEYRSSEKMTWDSLSNKTAHPIFMFRVPFSCFALLWLGYLFFSFSQAELSDSLSVFICSGPGTQ